MYHSFTTSLRTRLHQTSTPLDTSGSAFQVSRSARTSGEHAIVFQAKSSWRSRTKRP